MKVHTKVLVHYLSCPSPVDKEGFLFKKKQHSAVFRRRWFVLKGNVLFYQSRPADRQTGGAIALEGSSVKPEGERGFSLVFEGLRTYRFCVGERGRRDEWVKCLLTATHCYMSLLLRDLGLQYHAARLHSGDSSHMSSDLVLTPPPASSHSPQSASSVAEVTRATPRKSPNVWARRHAHVTPLNGPGPLSSDWPPVELREFRDIHQFYGREVEKARKEWRKGEEGGGEGGEEDRALIELF
ncbi:unnamed protein product [Knipowitschia caucasica]